MENLVSVIIPCYNQGKYIDEAIQSVLVSIYANIEIIVVNDGSTDEYTNEILGEKTWDKTVVYTIKNGGLSNARNFAIKKSKGKYILPLDADDKISPNYIADAIKVLDSNNTIKIVCCDVEMFGVKRGLYPLPEQSIEMLLGRNTMVVSSLFRRSDYDKTIGFNPNMRFGLEDWDFWLSLLETGGDVYKLNCVGFYYRIKKVSMIQSVSQEKFAKIRRQIYENHKELYSTMFFDPTKSFEYHLMSLKANSKEYKIGNIILKPIRFIFQLIRII